MPGCCSHHPQGPGVGLAGCSSLGVNPLFPPSSCKGPHILDGQVAALGLGRQGRGRPLAEIFHRLLQGLAPLRGGDPIVCALHVIPAGVGWGWVTRGSVALESRARDAEGRDGRTCRGDQGLFSALCWAEEGAKEVPGPSWPPQAMSLPIHAGPEEVASPTTGVWCA